MEGSPLLEVWERRQLEKFHQSFLKLQSFKLSIEATMFDDGPITEAAIFDSDVDDDASSLKYGSLLLNINLNAHCLSDAIVLVVMIVL